MATQKDYIDADFTGRTSGPSDTYSLLHTTIQDAGIDIKRINQVNDGCKIILNSDLVDWSAVDALVTNHMSGWVAPTSKDTYRIALNSVVLLADGSKVYLPLGGATLTMPTATAQAVYTPMSSGKLVGIRLHSTATMGSTIFTLEDTDAILGTITLNPTVDTNVYIDFENDLDSGVNTFDGSKGLAIGLDPATSTTPIVYFSMVFELDK